MLLCFPVYDSFLCLSIRVWGHDIANTFGVSVEQHREETAFHHMDGYVSVGVLTGSPDRRGEAQGQRPFAVPDAGD